MNNHSPYSLRKTKALIALAILFTSYKPLAIALSMNDDQHEVRVDPLPSLDELLGLSNQPSNDDLSSNDELDKLLTPREAGEEFAQAVQLMDQVAQKLSIDDEFSLSSIRQQEDILTKLDKIIESAKKNNSSGSPSSSSSSSSESLQAPSQQQAQGESESSSGGNESGESVPGSGGAGEDLNDQIAPNGVRWGSLPERLRETLNQGLSDQYSELYRALTEAYYRALAEDEDE